jgi:DNA-binding winged helix-turn-helix (wHTH) protein
VAGVIVAAQMKQPTDLFPTFTLGDWTVRPRRFLLERGEVRTSLEPRQMEVLLCLVDGAGDVVSIDRLLEQCWPGEFHGDNPVHKAIATLRKVLGDDAKAPRYVATVRKRGYRIVAPIHALPNARADQRIDVGKTKWVFDGSHVCRPMSPRHAARWLQTQSCFSVTLSYRGPAATINRARRSVPDRPHRDDARSTRGQKQPWMRVALLLCMSSTILVLSLCTWLAIADARRAIARADALHRRAEAIIACHDRRVAGDRPPDGCNDP